MKKLLCWILCIVMLCGCSLSAPDSYVDVQPHDEGYEIAAETSTITVTSYMGLKNALLDIVRNGMEEVVIRADSYTGDIASDLSDLVYEVQREDPLGAFALDYMTYDYSKIVSYYEIHIFATYKRTVEEMNSVIYVDNENSLKAQISEAMSSYEPILRLRFGNYREVDCQAIAQEVFREHPEFALEMPDVTVTSYPESGTERILEISFSYTNDRETLLEDQKAMQEKIEILGDIYASRSSDTVTVERFCRRLGRYGSLITQQEQVGALANSVYSALIDNYATSYGFAQAYVLLLEAQNIECSLIEGYYNGEAHSWCSVVLDDCAYYIDPTWSMMSGNSMIIMMTEEQLEEYGYQFDES